MPLQSLNLIFQQIMHERNTNLRGFSSVHELFLSAKLHVAYHDDDVLSTTRERVRIESTAPADRITNLGQRKADCHLPPSSSCAHHGARDPLLNQKIRASGRPPREIDLSYVKDARCHNSCEDESITSR